MYQTLLKTQIIAYLFLGVIAYAQQPSFNPITTNDGLSQNSVTSIAQDSFGFLWIATQDGLNRYDGSNFKRYDAYFDDITQESYSKLGKVYVDDYNDVWTITSDGAISLFNELLDKFEIVDNVQDASVILQEDEGEFWVGSYSKGLFSLEFTDGSWSSNSVIPDIAVYQILKEDDALLLATDRGVYEYNTNTKEQRSLFSELEGFHISQILRGSDGNLLIATFRNGLLKSSIDGEIVQVNSLPNDLRIQHMLEDHKGIIWVATYTDGAYMINGNGVDHFSHNPPIHNDINYNDVLCVFEDHQNNIWLGTDGGGLSFYEARRKPIFNITNEDIPPGMAVDVSRAVSTDSKGNVWIGTSGKGLTSYNTVSNEVFHYATDMPSNFKISSDRIVSLYHDDQDQLWIGTQEEGLLYYDAKTKVVKSTTLTEKTIWHILEKDGNEIWLCTRNNGLIRFDTESQLWQRFLTSNPHSLRVMVPAQVDGAYYVGTDDGSLLFFDEAKGAFKELAIDVDLGSVKSLYLERDELWIGSQKEGVVIYNLSDLSTRIINTDNGLPNKVVYALLNQNDEFLWISTNQGICQIDKDAVRSGQENVVNQLLTFQNGLASNEFNTGAYHKDGKGRMYFGGIDGVSWFDPTLILKNRMSTPIVLLELTSSIDGVEKTTRLHNKKEVRLNYKNRNFQIRYSDLTYSQKETVNFQYRLNGFNSEWIDNDNSRLVSFSNVSPGDYNFELRATNDDGIWSKDPVGFKLVIVPAFWQTSWFKGLVLVLLGLGGWFLMNLRINGIKNTAELKQNIAQSESKALRAQMSPHFIFNSLNAIDNYILNHDAQTASDYLSKFSKLMRQILDYSNLSEITLAQEIEILSLYVKIEQMRFPSKFDFEIEIDASIDSEQIKVPPLVFQPYAENAIWHGLMHIDYQGLLVLSVTKTGDYLECKISDNGIGRERAKEIKSKSATKRKSHGMQITQERINLLSQLKGRGGDVVVRDGSHHDSSTGTTVVITFPI